MYISAPCALIRKSKQPKAYWLIHHKVFCQPANLVNLLLASGPKLQTLYLFYFPSLNMSPIIKMTLSYLPPPVQGQLTKYDFPGISLSATRLPSAAARDSIRKSKGSDSLFSFCLSSLQAFSSTCQGSQCWVMHGKTNQSRWIMEKWKWCFSF